MVQVRPNSGPQGLTVSPELIRGRGTVESEGLPRKGASPNSPWEYMHHPNRWGFSPEIGFHPQLGKFHHTKGLGGIDQRGNLGVAQGALMKRGWTVVQADDVRLRKLDLVVHGQPWNGDSGYVKRWPVQGGGSHHRSVFDAPRVVGDRVRRWEVDYKALTEFIEFLLSEGIVPNMEPEVCDGIITRRETRLLSLEQDVLRNPTNDLLTGRLVTARREVAQMRGEDVDVAMVEAKAFATKAGEQIRAEAEQIRKGEEAPKAKAKAKQS